jgi:lytic cellulose monooxygenase (C1-hydroxylating)
MKSLSLLAAIACAQVALAHISIWGVWKNGEWQGDGREVYVGAPLFHYETDSR